MTFDHQPDCFKQAVWLLAAMPAGRRAGLVWIALSFEPCRELQIDDAVSALRSILAECWEHRTGVPIPIARFRALLRNDPTNCISVTLGRLNGKKSAAELAVQLNGILNWLFELAQSPIAGPIGSSPTEGSACR